jgi:hypothetical protein
MCRRLSRGRRKSDIFIKSRISPVIDSLFICRAFILGFFIPSTHIGCYLLTPKTPSYLSRLIPLGEITIPPLKDIEEGQCPSFDLYSFPFIKEGGGGKE